MRAEAIPIHLHWCRQNWYSQLGSAKNTKSTAPVPTPTGISNRQLLYLLQLSSNYQHPRSLRDMVLHRDRARVRADPEPVQHLAAGRCGVLFFDVV